jgi:DNA-binding NarL/FixJ family response regulator
MFAYRGNFSTVDTGPQEQDAEIGPHREAEGGGGRAVASIDAPGQQSPRTHQEAPLISIIDPRRLGRDTLTKALQAIDGTFRIRANAGVEEWLQVEDIEHETSAILLAIGAAGADDPDVVDQLQRLARTYSHVPTVVMGDIEDPLHIIKILGHGARGYIPTSVNLNVLVGAISLARAGGLFVPASSLMAIAPATGSAVTSPLCGLLTDRQAAVADAISRGKPNKVIAYELNLCESTVKVHIRGIMKKLQARNRTEVAFKMHSLAKPQKGGRPSWSTEMRA